MNKIPRHVAVVMDGNGRWAQKKFLAKASAYNKGIEAVRTTVDACLEYQIAQLTLFAFSSENWQRPVHEVTLLMSLLRKVIQEELPQLHRQQICLRIIGNKQALSAELQTDIEKAEALTADNQRLFLNIALNYGGKWDIVQAAQKIAQDVQTHKILPDEVNEQSFAQYLMAGDVVDLLIRTSGEQRISNFLLWHLAYAELYFTPVLWPDFVRADFDAAIQWFAGRERRFGHA
jgi:undecaprenyl diphosphate synthase